MSWARVYIHLVFSTKDRQPFLNNTAVRKQVFKHIKLNAGDKGIWLDCVNGHEDHAHCLISLDKEQTLSTVAQLIKGESSHWINDNKVLPAYFEWQDDYWVVGVSESHVTGVRKYIHEQEIHHANKGFREKWMEKGEE